MKGFESRYPLTIENKQPTKKQQQIHEAAIELFSQKGYAATSTYQIAVKANVAEGTVFRHYRTKKDLLYSIVLPVMDQLVSQFLCDVDEVRKRDESPEYLIRQCLLSCRAFINKHLPILKISLQEMPFQNSLKEAFFELVTGENLSRLKEVIEHYQMNGKLRNDLSSIAMIRWTGTTIVSFLIMFLVNNASMETAVNIIEVDQLVEFVMRGIESR